MPQKLQVQSLLEPLRRRSTLIPVLLLFSISVAAFWIRIEQRDHFADDPQYWATTAIHLATAKAITEGKPFGYVAADWEAGLRFIYEQDRSFKQPLSGFDRESERMRASMGDSTHVAYFGDQAGWAFLIVLTRLLPGDQSLSDVCTVQILLDLGALLLLYPIGLFITGGRRYVALGGCLLYAIYLPLAYASAEPWRDAWPGLAVIYSMGLLLPALKRGPEAVVRSVGWLIAAGVVAGLAVYVRSTAVTVPLTLAVVTFLSWRKFVPSAVAGATIVAAMLVTMSPWVGTSLLKAGVASVTSTGGGHSFLTGLGEEPNNPLGLRFDDTFTSMYIRNVCGYDVDYMTYAYSAACLKESKRFIADHKSWYAGLLGWRVQEYVWRVRTPRLKWGFGNGIPMVTRGYIERWLVPLGLAGGLLGLLVFPRSWIVLIWVLHFWVLIFPLQAHPRLLMGATWALLMGTAMLVGGLVLIGQRIHRSLVQKPTKDKKKKKDKKSKKKKKEPKVPPAAPVAAPVMAGERSSSRSLMLLGGTVFAVDLIALVLLTVFGPKAPSEARDWRAGLNGPDPFVRTKTLEDMGQFGNDAMPVLLAGLGHDDPNVRRKAVEVRRGFRVSMGRMDFAGGNVSGILALPGVELEALKDPRAENGYFLRVSAPRRSGQPLFALVWPHTNKRGIYKVGYRARLDESLSFAFLSGESNIVRERRSLGPSGFPMRDFGTWEIPYENRAGDDTVAVVFQQPLYGTPGPEGVMASDFDWIEIWQDMGSGGP
jgi:hypothetical protein